ncbi:hypothetical protein QWI17_20165 [Gilvimarinus sp. SDUM040013]|uniref:MSHA biogenesis protein MshD n=1 Tax=Gilvimarinus gilvus TaxID=3058038 RepID=A0ABU4RS52_9GAMM|nr:hypothetical protein [Gilvimarinus sp. SDUM040013]MDO3388172.1 hypothetical protein [Gilvimarinus sp. SDUM040013]MDX6847722.1 hypothetical protein [Gilvimarinus sp. SDUM040013]
MRIKHSAARPLQLGVTLIELVVFIVVISIALVAVLAVYQQSIINSVDPIKRIRMLELAQAQMDRVIALRYDEATPSGGIPACNSVSGPVCNNTTEPDLDDVDDYNGFSDTPAVGYSRQVTVTNTTLDGAQAKEINVVVSSTDGESLTLTSYRVNF